MLTQLSLIFTATILLGLISPEPTLAQEATTSAPEANTATETKANKPKVFDATPAAAPTEDTAQETEQSTKKAQQRPKTGTTEVKNQKASKNKKRKKKRKKKSRAKKFDLKSSSPSANSNFPKIKWFQPTFEIINKKTSKKKTKKRFKVTFLGQVETTVPVRLRLKKYTQLIKKGRFKKILSRRLLTKKSLKIKVDQNGFFSIEMTLPKGVVLLNLRLKTKQAKKTLQLSVNISKDKVRIKHAEERYRPTSTYIWLGLGVGVLKYQQNPPQDLSDIDYGSLSLPNIHAKGSIDFTSQFKMKWDFHSLKGGDLQTENGQIDLQKKSIDWIYFGIEAEYVPFKYQTWFGSTVLPSFLFGVQSQDMPFLVEVASPSFEITSFKFNSLSAGVSFLINPHSRWTYEAFMRIQSALATTGDISLNSGFAFDGSLGVIYNFTKHWKTAVFWNGQLHSYSYTIDATEGTYSLLSSNLDFALGYQF